MRIGKTILMLFLVFIIPRLLLITYVPMELDECLYAIMIEEQIERPTLIPTFFWYEVGWKPPVFFWLAGILVSITRGVGVLPLEVVYRLPNVIFGFVNLVLFYLLIRKISNDEKIALICGIAYALTPLTIFLDDSVLTDTLSLTFTLAAVYAYLKANENDRFLLLAGFFGFLGVFTKQVNALLAPVVMTGYFFQNNKKILTSRFFIISILIIPVAFLLNYSLYESEEQAQGVFYDLIENKIIDKISNPFFLFASFTSFFMLATIWLCLSLIGFIKWWKENYMFSIWYLLIIFPLIAGVWMPWYFLPVMPAIVYFAMKSMVYDENRKIRLDKFFWIVFVILTLSNLIIGLNVFYILEKDVSPKKVAGEMIASKENVLIIGGYSPTIFTYKMLQEKRVGGRWLDFGLVFSIMENNKIKFEMVEPFIKEYYGPRGENITDGNFGKMFFERKNYRKDTDITDFDYVVLVQVVESGLNGTLVFDESDIKIYDVRK